MNHGGCTAVFINKKDLFTCIYKLVKCIGACAERVTRELTETLHQGKDGCMSQVACRKASKPWF